MLETSFRTALSLDLNDLRQMKFAGRNEDEKLIVTSHALAATMVVRANHHVRGITLQRLTPVSSSPSAPLPFLSIFFSASVLSSSNPQ